MKHFTLALAATAAMLIAPSCSTYDMSRGIAAAGQMIQATTITDSQVQSYVHQYVTQLDQKNTILSGNNPYAVRLTKLTQGLTDVDGVPLNFKVYKTNEVNAFACADGSVRVYSGLMDLMDDDEVLGVIGHEIGHVAHKDTKRAMKEAIMASAGRYALSGVGGTVGALTSSQLGALGEVILNRSYTKKQESEADVYGYNFLKSHGKNPWAMAEAFSKLRTLEGSGSSMGSRVNQLFSDHPATDERIAKMESMARKDGIPKPADYKPLTK